MERIDGILASDENYTKIIDAKSQWTDPKFPHDTSVTKGLLSVAGWKRASEIFNGQEKVYESFSGEDVAQGEVKDSYLLAAVAALAEFPGRVEKLFLQKDKNSAGCYVVRLYVCGQYVDVAVDDYFPINRSNEPAFAGSNGKELWVMLIEKAWAKVHGSYNAIEGGDTRESLSAITGAPVEYYKHKDMRPDELWEMIHKFQAENYVMCSSAAIETKGITNNYAYILVNAYDLTVKNEKVRLVQLSNPLGKTEWNGAWGDKDTRWTAELREKVGHNFRDDGTFFMPFEDFIEVFTHSFIAKVKDTFLHSNLVIKGQKAFAAFQIRRELKGYISGYQITKRLGSIVVPNFNVERLKIELYKFNKNKLELVKDAWNNPVGQANMEVSIEPGIYVLKGSFDFSTKLPYIVFSIYGERKVNLVELDIKNQRHATLDKVSDALGTIKKAYTMTDSKHKSAGSFQVCLAGHKLQWSTEPCQGETEFECESCQEKKLAIEGRWLCDKCSYDVCSACRPQTLCHDENAATGDVLCNKDHKMKFAADEDKQSIFLCDKCGKAHYGTVARWRCDECGINLCRKCIQPPASFRDRDEVLEIETCPKNHKLEFVVVDSQTGTYECYICSKVGDVHNGRWACLDCETNVCPICKPSEKAKEGAVSVKTMTLACENGHILLFGCKPAAKGTTLRCYKCKKPIENNNWRWTCERCDFDICVNCRPEPEGSRDLLCANMHKLFYSTLPLGKITFGRCDRCRKVLALTSGRHCCFGCNYECCNNCASKSQVHAAVGNVVIENTRGRRPVRAAEEQAKAQAEQSNDGCLIF